jgi:hypothetical protein
MTASSQKSDELTATKRHQIAATSCAKIGLHPCKLVRRQVAARVAPALGSFAPFGEPYLAMLEPIARPCALGRAWGSALRATATLWGEATGIGADPPRCSRRHDRHLSRAFQGVARMLLSTGRDPPSARVRRPVCIDVDERGLREPAVRPVRWLAVRRAGKLPAWLPLRCRTDLRSRWER